MTTQRRFPLRRVFDSEFLVVSALERLDVERLLVHQVVVTVKAVVPGTLFAFKGLIGVGRLGARRSRAVRHQKEDEAQNSQRIGCLFMAQISDGLP